MRLEPLAIDGAWLVVHEPHHDERGWFARTFDAPVLAALGLETAIVEASTSFNASKHTLRGMHLQHPPAAETKVVRCTRGRVFDVLVDLRPGSPTHGQWVGVELGPDDHRSVVAGPGLAHGFLTLEDATEVSYLITAPYAPELAGGVRWDDPTVGIEWPAPPQVLSERDRGLPLLGT